MPSGDIWRGGIRPRGKEKSSRPIDAPKGLENEPRSRMLSVGSELTPIAVRGRRKLWLMVGHPIKG